MKNFECAYSFCSTCLRAKIFDVSWISFQMFHEPWWVLVEAEDWSNQVISYDYHSDNASKTLCDTCYQWTHYTRVEPVHPTDEAWLLLGTYEVMWLLVLNISHNSIIFINVFQKMMSNNSNKKRVVLSKNEKFSSKINEYWKN